LHFGAGADHPEDRVRGKWISHGEIGLLFHWLW
jgi:hypothetical protein